MLKQKRVVAIHDISCFGKCSLTVALPLLSVAGFETCCIPTAVLSTHTGGFTDYTYRDLTEDILPIAEHWRGLSLSFDAVYTGFLGSLEQVEILDSAISQIAGEDTLIFVDPVMGDNGALYPVFNKEFPGAMKKLCQRAHIIVPNMTEAYLLLGEDFVPGPYTKEEIDRILTKLQFVTKGSIVLTGVYDSETKLGAAVYDAKTGETDSILRQKVEGMYHGTGDVFASTLLAAILKGFSLKESAAIAAQYTVLSILTTKEMDKDLRYGVNFEYNFGELLKILNKKEEM